MRTITAFLITLLVLTHSSGCATSFRAGGPKRGIEAGAGIVPPPPPPVVIHESGHPPIVPPPVTPK